MINVLVLGAGITGLSAAYHLSRLLPPHSSRILLLERSARVGGWLQSNTRKQATPPLEAGPRTLRPTSLAIIELIHLLSLDTSLVIVPKHHPAARARYIHLPPLTLLPSSLSSLLASHLTTPPLRGLLPAILQEPLRKSNRNDTEDESAYSLVARRFGDPFAREYFSAIVHGIYAADSRSLSVRATFPFLWEAESRGRGSVLRGLFLDGVSKGPEPSASYQIGHVNEQLKGAAMFTFNHGIETLSRALFNHLSECPNVDIWQGTQINRLVPQQHGIHVETATGKPLPFIPTHVVSAIPLPALHNIVNSPSLPHLDAETNPASSVLVINLVFPPTPSNNLLHPDGFGYLVPRPPPSPIDGHDGYLTQHDVDSRAKKQLETFGEVDLSRAILGTIFDSAICFPGEMVILDKDGRGGRETRMTIMLGGPHPLPEIVTSLFPRPSESAAANHSLSTGDELALKLFIPPLLRTLAHTLSSSLKHRNFLTPRTFDEPFELGLPPPSYVRAHYHRSSIPTYTPEHLKRMDELRAALGLRSSSDTLETTSPWKGRMHVIGAGVGGVSLGDCVQQGRDVAYAIAREHEIPK